MRASLGAFIEADGDLAQSVLSEDDSMDRLNKSAYFALSSLIGTQPELIPLAMHGMMIARGLWRVGGHAKKHRRRRDFLGPRRGCKESRAARRRRVDKLGTKEVNMLEPTLFVDQRATPFATVTGLFKTFSEEMPSPCLLLRTRLGKPTCNRSIVMALAFKTWKRRDARCGERS